MRASLVFGLLVMASLVGCAPPPAPRPPQPPPKVLIGTPTHEVVTPALQALQQSRQDHQILIRFKVAADGRVSEAHADYTSLSATQVAAVLGAFQHWRFKPARRAGQPVAQDFIYPLFFGPDAEAQRTVFLCRNQAVVYAPDRHCEIVTAGAWRIYRYDPVYPPALLSQAVAGTVTLGFDIGPDGRAVHPVVLSAEPPGLFDAAAIAAVKQWYFEPVDANASGRDLSAARQHVTVSVRFTPPTVATSKH